MPRGRSFPNRHPVGNKRCFLLILREIHESTTGTAMLIWRQPSHVKFKKPVVTLGFFDGVHLGHTQLFAQLRDLAQQYVRPSLVISLWPHPRIVLGNDPSKFRLLNTLEYKTQLLEESGVDALLILDFNLKLAELSPRVFLEEVIYRQLQPTAILMGYDHRFGHNGEGNFELLKKFADARELPVYQGSPFSIDGVPVSSTRIRSYLVNGEIEQATRSLGREYGFWGTVVYGKQIGREIGFPTANIQPLSGWQLLPSYGVYSGYCVIPSLGEERRKALINVGTRPTIDIDGHVTIEAHIPSLNTTIYNQPIFVSFCHKIRNELRFETLNALHGQIEQDLKALDEL